MLLPCTNQDRKKLYSKKVEIEERYGKWYEEPKFDPTSESFDFGEHRQLVKHILQEFSGNNIGGKAITWEHLTATVSVKHGFNYETVGTKFQGPYNKAKKVATCTGRGEEEVMDILSDVSGYAPSGSMILVQAPPGAGTTTLLNLLTGKTHLYKSVSGTVLYNGEDLWDPELQRLQEHSICRVEQEDVHYAKLTVRDTLMFAAKCGFPDFMPYAHVIREHRVELIARIFGITHVLDTPVGDASTRGVSGGEKKRVTIAEKLVGSTPSVVVTDNFSRGLDASTTLDIVKSMRNFAKSSDVTCICSLQQIGNDAFRLFDKVLALDNGRCWYFGEGSDVEPYLNGLGFMRPPERSMADYVLSVGDLALYKSIVDRTKLSGTPKTLDELVQAYQNSSQYQDVVQHLKGNVVGSAPLVRDMPDSVKRLMSQESLLPVSSQLRLLVWRANRLSLDRTTLIFQIVTSLFVSIFIGSLFYNIGLDTSGAYVRGGVLFASMTFFALSAIRSIGSKYDEMGVFIKQREAHFYNASPFHIAGVLSVFINQAVVGIFFSVIVYFMSGLTTANAGTRFAYFYAMMVTLSTAMECITRFVSVILPNKDAALTLISSLIVSFYVFSGYLIAQASSPPWFIWIYWISPLQYAFRGLAFNEYYPLRFRCTTAELAPQNPAIPVANRVCSLSTGEAYLRSRFEYNTAYPWRVICMAIMWGMIALFMAGTVMLARRKRSKGRPYIPEAMRLNELDATTLNLETTQSETMAAVKPMILAWRHVNYDVPVKNHEKKRLLHDVSGYSLPGTMTALMGASGAGKTTLMDVLARRKTKGTIEGEVLVSGQAQDKFFGRMSGYVEQTDLHFAKATVREAIQFSANLRLSSKLVSKQERHHLVEKMLDVLELRELQNQLVGTSESEDGLTSEQRKRLTIAVELVAKPSILFLDEPTSGLDSRGAFKVARAMRRVAAYGCAVVCTIHQPSAEVFKVFDSLLLLQKGGEVVYFGPLGNNSSTITDYFVRNGGTPIAPDGNPADYVLEQIGAGVNREAKEGSKDWHDLWEASEEQHKVLQALEEGGRANPTQSQFDEENKDVDKEMYKNYARSYPTQLKYNIIRMYKSYWRRPEYNYTRFVSTLFQCLLLGLSFFRLGNKQSDVLLYPAAIFMGGLPALISISNSVNPVISDRVAFYRETMSRYYAPSAYYFPLGLAEHPFLTSALVVFVIVYFHLVGLPERGFGYYLLTSWLFNQWAVGTGAMIGALVPTLTTALILIPVLNIVLNNLTGFLIPPGAIPPWWIWIYWINPSGYFLAGNLKSLLGGLEFKCDPDELAKFPFPQQSGYDSCEKIPPVGTYTTAGGGTCTFCPTTSGDQLLQSFGLPDYDKWAVVGALFAFWFLSRFLGLLGFQYLRYLSR